jgi:hypothetical protein
MVSTPIIEEDSRPSIFQNKWQHNPDPAALPFPRDNPPFNLTAIDWHQLSITDAQFIPHSWQNLHHLISTNQLDELKRWPSSLKAYLAWTAHVKAKYGSATEYLLQQRLLWTPRTGEGRLRFDVQGREPFEHEDDFKILRNDWTYALEEGISHIVVWSKIPLEVDANGALTKGGRRCVEGFVEREFRAKAGEESEGEKVVWFKNTTNLQSVRALEHVHILLRGVREEVLRGWMN